MGCGVCVVWCCRWRSFHLCICVCESVRLSVCIHSSFARDSAKMFFVTVARVGLGRSMAFSTMICIVLIPN